MSNQKIVLLTGASSGIGEALAKLLAENGYFVFATARRTEKMEPFRSRNLEPLYLDVQDDASINTVIEHIQTTKGRLDILINNAGLGVMATIEGTPPSEVERMFDVNVFGIGKLIQAVLPMMRAQKAGRIINVSSVGGKVSMPFVGWYSATKHAVEGMSDSLRMELAPLGIDVVLVEPGRVKTGFDDVAEALGANTHDPAAYDGMKRGFRKLFDSGAGNALSSEKAAKQMLNAVQAANPKSRYSVGTDAKVILPLKKLLPDKLFDKIVAFSIKRNA